MCLSLAVTTHILVMHIGQIPLGWVDEPFKIMHSTCPLGAQNVHSSNAKCVCAPASWISFEEEIYGAKCRRGKQQQKHFSTACSKDLLLNFKENTRIGFHDLPLTHYLCYRVPTNDFLRKFCLYEKVAVIHP
jgi:hypothetical protein